MKSWMLGGVVLLSCLVPRSVQAEAPSRELLARLAEQEARIGKVMRQGAYTTSSRSQELDADGKLLHTRETALRTSHPGGKKVVRVEKVIVDGKDVTEAERAKEEGRTARETESPFASSALEKYRYELLGPDSADPSKVRLRFEPKEKSSSTFVGEAVVDPVAGEVVWIKQKPAANPPFVDRIEVEAELSTPSPKGRQFTWLRIEGKAGLPFFKKGFTVRVDFSGYEVEPAVAGASK